MVPSLNAPTTLTQPGPLRLSAVDVTLVPSKLRRTSCDWPTPTVYTFVGNVAAEYVGSASPVASGTKASERCVSSANTSVSEPTKSPLALASMSWTPTPRVRVGFHEYGIPLSVSSAAMPVRDTAPWPGRLLTVGLFCQRWWPPAYTALSVTSTVQVVSPPVYAAQVGVITRVGEPLVPKRATTSHPLVLALLAAPPHAPEVDTTMNLPSGEYSASVIYVSNLFEHSDV